MATRRPAGGGDGASAGEAALAEPLWERWAELSPRLASAPLLACFDYDGTLVPIRPTPEEAVADDQTLAALARLVACPSVRVAVVSGRPLGQLRELLQVTGLWLIGTHGLETATPEGDVATARDAAECRAALEPLRPRAAAIAARYPGVRVEDKGAAIALHTRLADRPAAAAAGEAFRRVAAAVPGFAVMAGKEVLEARPEGAHKGAAVTRLRERGEGVLYAGDDVTDEDAFAALAPDAGAVTVRVGDERPTAARYRLERQEEVAELIARLVGVRGAARSR